MITSDLNVSLLSCVLTGAPNQSRQPSICGVWHHALRLTAQHISASIDAMLLRSALVTTCHDLVSQAHQRARGQVTSSFCLFMVVVGCMHSIETPTNNNQLQLSTQSCIFLIIVARVRYPDALLGQQLAISWTSTFWFMAFFIHSASPLTFSM